MADKELPLDLGAGGSTVRTAGGEEFSLAKSTGFSLQPCATAAEAEIAPKRKAPAAGLDGCAQKMRGEEVVEEEEALWAAGDSEEYDESDLDYTGEVVKASFDAHMEKLFGNYPNVEWSTSPSPPGVYFPKPSDRRPPFGQNLAKKEEDAAA